MWVDCAVFRHQERRQHGKRRGDNQLRWKRWGIAGERVGKQEPTMGRVRCAFEDAGNGHGFERGDDNYGGARVDELVDLRGQEAEVSMQQPANKQEANERKGVSQPEVAAPGKPAVR